MDDLKNVILVCVRRKARALRTNVTHAHAFKGQSMLLNEGRKACHPHWPCALCLRGLRRDSESLMVHVHAI